MSNWFSIFKLYCLSILLIFNIIWLTVLVISEYLSPNCFLIWLIKASLVHHFRPFLKIIKYSGSPTPVIINDVVPTEVFTDNVKRNIILSLLLVLMPWLCSCFFFAILLTTVNPAVIWKDSHLLEGDASTWLPLIPPCSVEFL